MLLGKYKNGNYFVNIYEDGTKIKYSKDNYFKPDFAESIDCCITKKCSMNCPFCYENCTPHGYHAKLIKDGQPQQYWISTLHEYTELALNGNDLDHPELEDFLIYLKDNNIIANITVNQTQFLNNYDKLLTWYNKDLFKGLGVSVLDVKNELIDKIKNFPTIVIHTIAGLLDENIINKLKNQNLAILILGYKNIGRGESYKSKNNKIIKSNIDYLKENISDLFNYFKIVSFDNLALTQLDIKKIIDNDIWDRVYSGDDGQFTFYIDAVSGKFSKNSRSNIRDRLDINNLSVDDMFYEINQNLTKF